MSKPILITAEQKYIRISPRKIRLIANAITKLPPLEAIDRLNFLNKRGAKTLAKTIKQAMANAVNNLKIKQENLKFAKIEVLKGATNKRWRPVSKGRAHSIFKRTSHIKIILEVISGTKN